MRAAGFGDIRDNAARLNARVDHVRDGVDGNFTNARLQSQCPLRIVGHIGLIADGAVADGVMDALGKRAIRFDCFAI